MVMKKIDLEKVKKDIKYIPCGYDWSKVPSEKRYDMRDVKIFIAVKNDPSIFSTLENKYFMDPVDDLNPNTGEYTPIDYSDTNKYPWLLISGYMGKKSVVRYFYAGKTQEEFDNLDKYIKSHCYLANSNEELFSLIDLLYTDEVYVATGYICDPENYDKAYGTNLKDDKYNRLNYFLADILGAYNGKRYGFKVKERDYLTPFAKELNTYSFEHLTELENQWSDICGVLTDKYGLSWGDDDNDWEKLFKELIKDEKIDSIFRRYTEAYFTDAA